MTFKKLSQYLAIDPFSFKDDSDLSPSTDISSTNSISPSVPSIEMSSSSQTNST